MVTLACLLTGCTVSGPVPAPTPTGTAPAAVESLEGTIGRFMEDDVTSVVVQVRWEGGEWSRAYGLRDGLTRWRDGCSPTGYGYGHRGSVYGYLSTSISSDDGARQVTIGMALPTLPTEDGDPVTGRRLDRYASQMELAAQKTIEQLCG